MNNITQEVNLRKEQDDNSDNEELIKKYTNDSGDVDSVSEYEDNMSDIEMDSDKEDDKEDNKEDNEIVDLSEDIYPVNNPNKKSWIKTLLFM